MLKLDAKLKLTVKNRTKLLTKEFLFALSIAFLLHFIAFVLFHVDLGLFSVVHEYPTAIVQSSDAHIVANDLEPKPPSAPSFLVISKPKAPTYPVINDLSSRKISFDLSHLELTTLARSSHYYIYGNSFQKEPAPLSSKKPCKAKLEYKAANGKIFWLDWIDSTQDRKLDYQIVEALKKADLSPIASHGQIEIDFHI